MSTGLAADRPMSKKGDSPVRIDPEVIKKAKVVASFDGKTLTEYLSDLLRPVVDRDYRKRIKRAYEQGDEGTQP